LLNDENLLNQIVCGQKFGNKFHKLMTL